MSHGRLFFADLPLATLFPRRLSGPAARQLFGGCRLRLKSTAMSPRYAPSREGGVRKQSVAGSFLFKLPNGDGKDAQVALFRRSARVSTYQHRLAPISGSIEADDVSPLATALREINEETSLTLSSIELLCVGKPYTFTDDDIYREGKGEQGIVIDWEHEDFEWFNPLDVNESEGFGGVPKLVNSLRRVWPEYDLGPQAGKVLTSGLRQLRDDHENGARQLANMAVSTLLNVIASMDQRAIDDSWWGDVRMAAWHICQTRESMGSAITSAVVRALDLIQTILLSEIPRGEVVPRVVEALKAQLGQRRSTTDRIRAVFVDYLRHNVIQTDKPQKRISVLTLSSSSTISDCLLGASADLGVPLDLRILESRPLCEGVTLASRLLAPDNASVDFTVTLYSDASAALAANDVDAVVLGADRISSAGDVSNKIGSLPAILSQRYSAPDAKVIILSETDKIARPGLAEEHPVEENSPMELMRAWNGNVKGAQVIEDALRTTDESSPNKVRVRNAYFEWIPARYVHAYVTDEGLWSVENIAKRSKWIGEETDRFFKDL
ncbi:nagb/rpia/CoA transferase-like protein [Durotheca rogersii]|uniref:nagb/rpia/CoA transferase-like protein n=1 Tax=Durotheca rogersii TaxID=419775 RepID=UPI002220B445|nr:nagb/rpia/CoA transferase-like protein [Durotheca rogersii]KAI5859246.1 nagb/rpia/CoA transferase-like protein [Durotheca rogersii]